MTRIDVLAFAAGAAILLTGTASPALAQSSAPPHSTVRIPLGKDLAPPRVDTVQTTRVDTVRLAGRVDTITHTVTVERVITRVDSVVMPVQIPHVGSLYAGIAAGASFAAPQFTNSVNPGWRVEVPLGIDPVGSPLGFRVSLSYARYTPQSYYQGVLGDAQTMGADADLKLRLLSVTSAGMRIQVYGLAGGTYARFMNVVEYGNGTTSVGSMPWSGTSAPSDQSWHSGFGWNTGAGASVGKGNTHFFTELRFTNVRGVVSNIASIPLVVGVTLY